VASLGFAWPDWKNHNASGIVQGAGPNVEAGLSLGVTALVTWHLFFCPPWRGILLCCSPEGFFLLLGVIPDPMWGQRSGMSDCKALWGEFVNCDIWRYKINWIKWIEPFNESHMYVTVLWSQISDVFAGYRPARVFCMAAPFVTCLIFPHIDISVSHYTDKGRSDGEGCRPITGFPPHWAAGEVDKPPNQQWSHPTPALHVLTGCRCQEPAVKEMEVVATPPLPLPISPNERKKASCVSRFWNMIGMCSHHTSYLW